MFQLISSKYYQGANIHAAVPVARHEFSFTGLRTKGVFRSGLADFSLELEKAAERAGTATDRHDALAAFGQLIAELLFLGGCRLQSGGLRRPSVFPQSASAAAVTHEYETEDQTTAAVALALRILGGGLGTRRNREDTLLADIRSFIRRGARGSIKASTDTILRAAEARGIPWLWSQELGMFQLGHGCKRKWIDLTLTHNTPSLAVTIARDKELTNRLLLAHDLPVPRHIAVKKLEDAVAAAKKIGWPAVIKPRSGHKGQGITVGVKSTEELKTAFQRAKRIDSTILVEQMLTGSDHRILVVGGRMIAALRREPAQVRGDGKSTIEELVALENRRRNRLTPGSDLPLQLTGTTERTLAAQGFTRKSVPKKGKAALLKTVANWSQGGTAVDVTDAVHPDNRNAAIRATSAIGLDVAGVDFLIPDISRSYAETGGGICEVNFRPGLLVHLAAMRHGARDVGGPIIDSLFRDDGRIPIIAVLDQRRTGCADRLASLLSASGRNLAVLDGDQFTRIIRGARSSEQLGWRAAISVALQDPDIHAVILNLGSDDVIAAGCGLAHSALAVLVNDPADAAQDLAWSVISGTAGTSVVIADGNEGMAAAAAAATLGLPAAEIAPCALSGGQAIEDADGARRSLRQVARQSGLPVQSIVEWREIPLMQFGLGIHQRRYRTAKTMRTNYLSTRIADDKASTNRLLRMHGLPCPDQEVAASKHAAGRIAERMGFPVIVKPLDSSESRGVAGNIQNHVELTQAVERARKYSKQFLVERFYQGDDHRFLVIEGKVAHVTRHEPAAVIGNGTDSVEALVEALNQDPLRGPDRTQPYVRIKIGPDQLRMLERPRPKAGVDPGKRA